LTQANSAKPGCADYNSNNIFRGNELSKARLMLRQALRANDINLVAALNKTLITRLFAHLGNILAGGGG